MKGTCSHCRQSIELFRDDTQVSPHQYDVNGEGYRGRVRCPGSSKPPAYPPLTAFRVTYDDGDARDINMAAGVTLEQARAYFIGKTFEVTETTHHTAISVETI